MKSIDSLYAEAAAATEIDTDAEDIADIIMAEAVMRDRSNVPDTDADALLNDETAATVEVEADEDDTVETDEN